MEESQASNLAVGGSSPSRYTNNKWLDLKTIKLNNGEYMNTQELAKKIDSGQYHGLQVDARIQELFPGFKRFFADEIMEVTLEFMAQYLPDVHMTIRPSPTTVQLYRPERIPGVGVFNNILATVKVRNNNISRALLVACLLAYEE